MLCILNVGTVPTLCILYVGTVPTLCILNVGTVPTFSHSLFFSQIQIQRVCRVPTWGQTLEILSFVVVYSFDISTICLVEPKLLQVMMQLKYFSATSVLIWWFLALSYLVVISCQGWLADVQPGMLIIDLSNLGIAHRETNVGNIKKERG